MPQVIGGQQKDIFITKVVLTACAVLMFFFVTLAFPQIQNLCTNAYIISILLSLVFAGGCLIFTLDKRIESIMPLLFVFASLGAMLIVRGSLFYFISGDYSSFLEHWVDDFRNAPGLTGLTMDIGDYNMPYLYLLFGISRVNFPDLYLIKIASVIFDIMLAYYASKLISLKSNSINVQIIAFVGTLALPTVIINSSMWGQCDSIYAALALASIYHGVKGNSKLCFMFVALAFSVKLQTIFIFPVIVILLVLKKIDWKMCWISAVSFIATLLPAIIVGKPIKDTVSIYFDQTSTYDALNMNATNIYKLVGEVSDEHFTTAAIFLAGAAVIALLYFIYVCRDRVVSVSDYIYIAFLFSFIIPFLLPRMHDRYFFVADVLSFLVFMVNKKRWFVPVVTVMCSYISYTYFVMGGKAIFEHKYAVIAAIFVVLIVAKDLAEKLYLKKEVY